MKKKATTTPRKRIASARRANQRRRKAYAPLIPRPTVPPVLRPGTLDDLRALDDESRKHIVDFVINGIPMASIRGEIQELHGLVFDSDEPLVTFYQEESRNRWEHVFRTASADADAMVNALRHSSLDFSETLLKALGQETFRMVTQRELNFKQIEKFTRLLLQARGQDNTRQRSTETLRLQREKMERQFRSRLDHALDSLAEEIRGRRTAREYFALFRTKLKEEIESTHPTPKLSLTLESLAQDNQEMGALPRQEDDPLVTS